MRERACHFLQPVVIAVTEEWHVLRAVLAAGALARSAGLGETAVHCLTTSVSELANNLCLHADGGGVISLEGVREPGRVGVHVIAQDQGPGIPDVEQALADGFTTNGGLGAGLSGVARLMDEFELRSESGSGTEISATKWERCR